MFDIGFFELLIIAAVGLVVIGPERLPGTVRTCGLWLGRLKRSLTETRREIEQQLGADEIRRELRNEEIMRNLEKMHETRADLEQRIQSWQDGEGERSIQPPEQNSASLEHQPEPESESEPVQPDDVDSKSQSNKQS